MDKSKNPDEHYSFLIGSVKSYSDVSWEFGEFKLDFVVATLDTALGNIPVAMSRDVFDLSALSVDSVIAMKADIKVDLSNAEDFTSREPD